MNDTLTMQPGMLAAATTGEGIRLLGLPAEKSAKNRLSGSADEVVKTIASLLNQMVMGAIDKRSAAEFIAVRDEVFPKYVQLVISLAGIVTAVVPSPVLSRLANESFSELEADIREHALSAFGTDMRERAMFTVWTLRKIADLLSATTGKIAEEDGQKAKEFVNSFLIHALNARFGIDCLRASMRSGHTIYPEVLPVIADNLRSAVDAYAWIKQVADLRSQLALEQPVAPTTWDSEDDQLLKESMIDLSHE